MIYNSYLVNNLTNIYSWDDFWNLTEKDSSIYDDQQLTSVFNLKFDTWAEELKLNEKAEYEYSYTDTTFSRVTTRLKWVNSDWQNNYIYYRTTSTNQNIISNTKSHIWNNDINDWFLTSEYKDHQLFD